jgi:hypothetical protein
MNWTPTPQARLNTASAWEIASRADLKNSCSLSHPILYELIVKLKNEERILKRCILVFWAVALFIPERKSRMSFWVIEITRT